VPHTYAHPEYNGASLDGLLVREANSCLECLLEDVTPRFPEKEKHQHEPM
jgi:hypothetical protein